MSLRDLGGALWGSALINKRAGGDVHNMEVEWWVAAVLRRYAGDEKPEETGVGLVWGRTRTDGVVVVVGVRTWGGWVGAERREQGAA
jgi:hypothetical protein